MTWKTLTKDEWLALVPEAANARSTPMIAGVITAFDTTMMGAQTFAVHEGSLRVEDDFVPPADNAIILGDLTVTGHVATADDDIGRWGGATLIVMGSVACRSVFNGEACLLLISGHCTVCEWVYGAIMDASFVVGGDFVTPIFFGSDIWVEVGGATAFDHGDGRSLPLRDFNSTSAPGSAVRANKSIAESLRLLDIDMPATQWTYDHISALGERYYDTGSILPDHGKTVLTLPENAPERAARIAVCGGLDVFTS